MSDVVERAKAALEGVTPGPWEHRTAPHEADDSSAAHEEWLAGTLIRSGEPLHVLIAESNQPQFAYIVPAVTGDGPTSATNADFVAAARSLVPELVAEIEKLRTHLSAVPSAIEGYAAAELTSVSYEGGDPRTTFEDKLRFDGERETLLKFQRNAEDIVAYAATAQGGVLFEGREPSE